MSSLKHLPCLIQALRYESPYHNITVFDCTEVFMDVLPEERPRSNQAGTFVSQSMLKK